MEGMDSYCDYGKHQRNSIVWEVYSYLIQYLINFPGPWPGSLKSRARSLGQKSRVWIPSSVEFPVWIGDPLWIYSIYLYERFSLVLVSFVSLIMGFVSIAFNFWFSSSIVSSNSCFSGSICFRSCFINLLFSSSWHLNLLFSDWSRSFSVFFAVHTTVLE